MGYGYNSLAFIQQYADIFRLPVLPKFHPGCAKPCSQGSRKNSVAQADESFKYSIGIDCKWDAGQRFQMGQVMGNNPTSDKQNKPATGISACRARVLGASNLVQCCTESSSCYWRIAIDDGQFCGHPSSRAIARGILPTAWSTSAPNPC